MGFPWPLGKRTKKEDDEASCGKEALKKCAQRIIKVEEYAPDGIALYKNCHKQWKEMENCLDRCGRKEALLEELIRQKEGKAQLNL